MSWLLHLVSRYDLSCANLIASQLNKQSTVLGPLQVVLYKRVWAADSIQH